MYPIKKIKSMHVKSFIKAAIIVTSLSYFNLILHYFVIKNIRGKINRCSSLKIKKWSYIFGDGIDANKSKRYIRNK